MIALGLYLIGLSGPKIATIEEPKSDKVIVQVYVPAPKNLSDREQAAWEVLAETLYDGTTEFSRGKLQQYSNQAGVPLAISAMPDYMCIQVVEPKGGLKVGAQLVDAICHRATLSAEAIADSIKRLIRRPRNAWEGALFDLDLPYAQVSQVAVQSLYFTAMQPANMSIVVAGSVTTAEVNKEMAGRWEKGPEIAVPRTRFDRAARQKLARLGSISTYELRAKPISLTRAETASLVLSVYAIGVGKEASLFRVLRDQMGVAYRHEAVFWPTVGGWQPRIVFASTKSDILLGGQAREALIADVQKWDETSLVRAKAMCISSFNGQNPLNPLYSGQKSLDLSQLQDRGTWVGLSQLMTGVPIDAGDVIANINTVKLDELKVSATKMLEEASISVILAR